MPTGLAARIGHTGAVIMVKGKTIWGAWALVCATCAVGCLLIAAISWSFPGPRLGPIALGLALLLGVVASRLYVRIDPDGLSVPHGLRRGKIRPGVVAGLSISRDTRFGTAASSSTLVVHFVDGSQRLISSLISFDSLPGGRMSMLRVADLVAESLSRPIL